MTRNNCGSVLPKMTEVIGTLYSEMKRCGRANCHCALGELHGPYHYLYYRQNGRLVKRYVRQADLAAVQAQCAARSSLKNHEREARLRRRVTEHAAREEYRRLIERLKQTTGDTAS